MIKPFEKVLEIGTGKGALTKELCKASERIEAFELDYNNFQETAALDLRGVNLHLGDAFSEPRSFDVLVSSLPYSESSTLVEWLSGLDYDRAVVLLQKDFVEKLNSQPGDEMYRAISVISQISSTVLPIRTVERTAFLPQPRVTSVVAMISPKCLLSSYEIRLIRILFSQKRRRLSGALKRLDLDLIGGTEAELSKRIELYPADEVASLLVRLRTASL